MTDTHGIDWDPSYWIRADIVEKVLGPGRFKRLTRKDKEGFRSLTPFHLCDPVQGCGQYFRTQDVKLRVAEDLHLHPDRATQPTAQVTKSLRANDDLRSGDSCPPELLQKFCQLSLSYGQLLRAAAKRVIRSRSR